MKLFLLLFALFGHFDKPDESLHYITPIGADTIQIEGYTFIELRQNYGGSYQPVFMISVIKDSTILLKVADDREVSLYNFNSDTSNLALPIYARNIDNDSIKEVIFISTCSGSGAFQNILVYSLGDTNKFKDSIWGSAGADLWDIDNDSIPEYIYYGECTKIFDDLYERYTIDQYPYAIEIWKWDQYNYRIANLKFRHFMLNYYFSKYTDARGIPFFEDDSLVIERVINWAKSNCSDSVFCDAKRIFPPPNVTALLIYLFECGYTFQADSVLDSFWPAGRPGKDEYEKLFWWYRDDKFLNELRDSDW